MSKFWKCYKKIGNVCATNEDDNLTMQTKLWMKEEDCEMKHSVENVAVSGDKMVA